jgi:hypothetical protein
MRSKVEVTSATKAVTSTGSDGALDGPTESGDGLRVGTAGIRQPAVPSADT